METEKTSLKVKISGIITVVGILMAAAILVEHFGESESLRATLIIVLIVMAEMEVLWAEKRKKRMQTISDYLNRIEQSTDQACKRVDGMIAENERLKEEVRILTEQVERNKQTTREV